LKRSHICQFFIKQTIICAPFRRHEQFVRGVYIAVRFVRAKNLDGGQGVRQDGFVTHAIL